MREWEERQESIEAEKRRLMQEEGLDEVNADYRARVTYLAQQ